MVRRGELGEIRVGAGRVRAGLAGRRRSRTSGQKQAAWRTDPARAGAGGCSRRHRHACLSTSPGSSPACSRSELLGRAAHLRAGPRLDDNVQSCCAIANGARGMLWASQVAAGHENGLRLRVYGKKAGLEWDQEHPNDMWFTPLGEPPRLTRGRVRRARPRTPRASRPGIRRATRSVRADLQGRRVADGSVGRRRARSRRRACCSRRWRMVWRDCGLSTPCSRSETRAVHGQSARD